MDSAEKKLANEYGLYLGGLSVLVSVMAYIFDLPYETQQQLGYLGLLFALGFIIFILKKVKSISGGYMNFKQGFKTALRMIVISSILSSAYLLTYTLVINPDYQDEIIEASLEQMEEQDLPEESMEMAVEWTRKFTSPWLFVVWGFLGGVIPSLIIIVIAVAIMQKPKPVFENTVE